MNGKLSGGGILCSVMYECLWLKPINDKDLSVGLLDAFVYLLAHWMC